MELQDRGDGIHVHQTEEQQDDQLTEFSLPPVGKHGFFWPAPSRSKVFVGVGHIPTASSKSITRS